MFEELRNLTDFGEILKQIRNKQDYSLVELSEISGLSVNTIHKLEKGRMDCTLHSLARLSFYLKTNLFEILSLCPNSLLKEVLDIKTSLDIDLSNRNYSMFRSYIDNLELISASVKFNPNIPEHEQFFDYIDKMILWIRGMSFFVSKEFIKAEEFFLMSLRISDNEFSLDELDEKSLHGLDISVFNSFIMNRLESENFEDIDRYVDYFRIQLLNSPVYYHSVFIRFSFNIATLHFHRTDYYSAIDLVDSTIDYMKMYNLRTDYSTLVLVKAVSRYKLCISKDQREIVYALNAFVYEGKGNLINTILHNLNHEYDIQVNYDLPIVLDEY